MLTLLLGTDWTANRKKILDMIALDVAHEKAGTILMVPELISHDTERRLCAAAGDTSSRFAEVLTFTRLAQRVSDAAGYGAPECLDNGGRLVAMASATRQLHSKLKSYASVETRPEFLTDLVDAVDEFKRCCITPEDLQIASRKTEGSFAQKLEELALILQAYDSLCSRGKRDPRDLMTWLLEQLEESDFAQKHTFYIDGFPDFTRQHMAIIKHLIANASNVVVSLTCDSVDTDEPAFKKASDTAYELLQLTKQLQVDCRIVAVDGTEKGISAALPALFQGKITQTSSALNTYSFDTIIDECHAAAEKITELIQAGCRYRDISVVCTDMAAYANMLDMVLPRYKIPLYQAGTEDILDKTVITTVLSAIDAVVGGFERSDILRYLKSALSPLDLGICDKLENYAIIWNITGKRWTSQWEHHPEGLGVLWRDSDREELKKLNTARALAIEPLVHLEKTFKEAIGLADLVEGVIAFLNEIELDKRLQTLAAEMEQKGDFRSSQILVQLWEILLSALEQLSDVLGQTHWDVQTFTKLLKLLLSQYDVGTIPAVLDAVMVGSVSAMRCQNPKHLFVLGANEGLFPAYSGSAGVLTDAERTALRQLGVPLTGGAMEGLQAEFSEIYGVFCGAEETVSVFCSGGQPSFLHRRLCQMCHGERAYKPVGVATDPMEISAYLLRNACEDQIVDQQLRENFRYLQKQNSSVLGQVSQDGIRRLYGSNIKLSASQVDKLADCRLSYFLRYGLKLKERKIATVDPAEFGSYVHAVLEKTGKKVMSLGGFHKVTLEETLKIANEFSEEYILDRFHQIDSQRVSYLFRRNTQELKLVVAELWEELCESNFEPVEFELAFDAIPVNGTSMTAVLRGFVDRVDAWEQNGQAYYRVVDYKTGRKDFDYCDVYNGLGLQMLLYLFALEDGNLQSLGEHPVPAGVQYFPARVPVIPADGRPEEKEVFDTREKLWKRKGLILSDEEVLKAMESDQMTKRLSYVRKKDGSISGDLADRQQFKLLKGYIFALLGKMVDDISSGCIAPNPYTRGGRHNACAFCPYGNICKEFAEKGRRDYAAMNATRFWEEIEKEMSSNG